ncbi:MAG: hypothetical protein RIT45_2631 [Pseudomonadota bacterium]|jgi:aminoglycoside phosphotransferase (APT) family kinase protein
MSDALAAAVRAHLETETGGTVEIQSLRPLAGGACQDNFRVDVTLQRPTDAGAPGPRRFVLRSDALRSLPGSIPRRVEARVIGAAVDAGVRTPPARYATEDLVREGASACFLDWRDGVAIGRKVVSSAELASARVGLLTELGGELARIHSIRPEHAPDLFEGAARAEHAGGHDATAHEPEAYGSPRAAPGAAFELDPVADALDALSRQLEAMHEPHPALRWVLRWLRANAPSAPEVCLVHGDFRVGNFLVSPAGLQAVLDWEFSHWGAPEEDLAWICVRDWRFGRLDLPAGGIGSREALVAAYERAAGRRVAAADLHWWEVMGNARWAAGAVHQAERVLSGDETDLEYVAIGRRAAEMEWEALRLARRGPAAVA